MTINLSMPVTHELRPRITVVGVGGAGTNAVNNMITSHLEGVEFVACNTDAQSLHQCLTERRIQLGNTITQGLGAGARPEIGRASAEEAIEELLDQLNGSHMVFITAGMGGGTGTGAAPVIARAVREQGILTVGVVTKPFHFEGTHRMRVAEGGLAELQQYVDTLLVIPNQNLFRLANERTTFADAFKLADNVLHMGVRGVTDLMVMPGLINLDFADIRTVMSEMGKAMMGTGEADGERRAVEAAEAAISNPLLDEVSMKGARGVLINITGGMDMTLFEVDEAANRVREEVDPEANIIVGSTMDESMDGQMRVSVVATGIDAGDQPIYGQGQSAAEPQAHAAPTFRLRPQGQQPPAGGQEGHRAPSNAGMPEIKPMSASSPDGGFSPDQPAGMTSQAGAPQGMAPGLRPQAQHGGEVVASARRPKPSFAQHPPQQPPMTQPQGADWGQTRMPEKDLSRAPSLFERVTQSFARQRQEHVEPQPEPAMAGGEAPERRQAAKDEDLYDIPTFLRR
ncbi:MAG: cell division protein FtsZ [Alphaproteobacteria bacterium]|nr:cell division protein FtsZ [Alphaproteobacteria bacterium]